MAGKKYLDENGLSHLGLLIKENFVKKELKTGSISEHKTLSDNNLTDELLEKIQNAGDSSFTGNYNDLTNKPDLTIFPTKTEVTSEINRAVENIDKVDLTGYIREEDIIPITNAEIEAILSD